MEIAKLTEARTAVTINMISKRFMLTSLAKKIIFTSRPDGNSSRPTGWETLPSKV